MQNQEQAKFGWVENFALFATCSLALSVSLGVAMVSISCLLVVLSALFLFIKGQTRELLSVRGLNSLENPVSSDELSSVKRQFNQSASASDLWTPWAIGAGLLWIAISIFWSISSWSQIGAELVRSARILVIPLVLYNIRSEEQVLKVIGVWVWGQIFVILSSYWLWLGLSAPWALSEEAVNHFTPYTTSLDQPIMSAVTFGVIWFFKEHFAKVWGKWGGLLVYAVLALFLVNVCFLMIGRSGMLSMILVLTVIGWWTLKPKFRKLAVFIPFIIFGLLYFASPKFQDRISKIPAEVTEYKKGKIETSQAIRLEFWNRSVQAITQKPLLGFGVGSWPQAYIIALNGEEGIQADSPHQQFLLWWVEEGSVGFILLVAIYVSILLDAYKLELRAKYALISTLNVLFFTSLMNCPLQGAGISEFFCLIIGAMMVLKPIKKINPLIN